MLDSIDQKQISVGTRCRKGGGGHFILPGIKKFQHARKLYRYEFGGRVK